MDREDKRKTMCIIKATLGASIGMLGMVVTTLLIGIFTNIQGLHNIFIFVVFLNMIVIFYTFADMKRHIRFLKAKIKQLEEGE